MNGYSWVSVISIFCYLFLLLAFIASKKTEKVIRSFIVLMGIMILWNGGSLGMRIQLWPSVNLWHHISLLGMLLLPYGYFRFIQDFLDENSSDFRRFWLIFYLLVFLFNCVTGFFIPLPEVITNANGSVQFLYHYNWHIYLLFVLIAPILVHIFFLIWRHCRGNHLALQQLQPVLGGILTLVLGHLLATLPLFVGLPVDMLSGIGNALFFFYALYKKKLFRMTILLSKSNCGIIAMVLGMIIFYDLSLVIQHFLISKLGVEYAASLIIIAVFLVGMILALYFFINFSFDRLFTQKEKKQNAALAHFAEEITHMMNVDKILQLMSDILQDNLDISRMFILIRALDGHYRIEHTLNPLEGKRFFISADHPLITFLRNHHQPVLFQDFSRKPIYQSLWETEKELLISQQLECFVPLQHEGDLTGLIMFAGRPGKNVCHPNNLRFVQSISEICAGALKNANSYEHALKEAQKDELTGLVNFKFFYELLDREFEKHKDTALSLCLINIDDFKLYNQLYGAHEGDLALQRIACILSASINDNSYAARINGDEFALILPGYDIYSAKCLADNIAEQIRKNSASFIGNTSCKLTVSAGICAAPYMASSPRELYRNADTTVYTVKRTGKNAVQIYSADINKREPDSALYKSGYNEHANTIYALTAAIDAKDHYTFKHSQNVAFYASELAKAACMPSDVTDIVREASLLHDIGKIGIREEILNKPGKLTPDEFELMKSHVENAVNIIRHLPSLDYVIPAVLSHHERYDGKGYPRGLEGENIPVTGRILCIADSFDAMTSIRNYKEAIPLEEAVRLLRAESGKQFDPGLVDIFTEMIENGRLELQ